jgi:transketolase
MRKAVVDTLTTLASEDDRIVLMTGDLGFMALEPFAERHPSRFFNAGVAEQNMVGVATGLAEAGLIPFVYSIAPFAALRPYEFIRNGPILHRLPVRILGVGGGFEYGAAGPTHFGLEDVAVMRAQPGINVFAPADGRQAAAILRATWNLPGPAYYRLGKNDAYVAPGLDGDFAVEKAQVVRQGRDVAFFTLGPLVTEAMDAANVLDASGISCAVVVVASIAPAPVAQLSQLLASVRAAVTVEAHFINGGLGSLISEIVASAGTPCRVVRCGVRTTPDGRTGSEAWHRQQHGLTASHLTDTVRAALA